MSFFSLPLDIEEGHGGHFYPKARVQQNNTLIQRLRGDIVFTVQMSRGEEPMWTLWKYSSELLTWGIAINVTFHHLTDKVTKGGVWGTWVIIVDAVTATTGERERDEWQHMSNSRDCCLSVANQHCFYGPLKNLIILQTLQTNFWQKSEVSFMKGQSKLNNFEVCQETYGKTFKGSQQSS